MSAQAIGKAESGQTGETADLKFLPGDDENSVGSGPKSEDANDVYQIDEGIWDVLLVMFFNNTGDERIFTPWDTGVLWFAIIINYAIQASLLITVGLNMCPSAFTESTIENLLNYRVNSGHYYTSAHPITRSSMQDRLCSGDAWSYETSSYGTMSTYSNASVPGSLMGALTLMIWHLSSFEEFRKTVLQIRLFFSVRRRRRSKQETSDDDTIKLTAITPTGVTCAMFLLIIPRLAIVGALIAVGSTFVGQTYDLGVFIINGLTLTVITDLDHFVYRLFVTNRMSQRLSLIEPTRLHETTKVLGGVCVIDFIRYFFMVLSYVLCCTLILKPFSEHVRAAEQAVCAGDLKFIWSNEFASDARPTTLIPYDSSNGQCSTETYLNAHLPGAQFNGLIPSNSSLPNNYVSNVLTQMWRTEADTPPDVLDSVLKDFGVTSGSGPELPACNSLNIAQGSASCSQPFGAAPFCAWTIQKQVCEGPPPGRVFDFACGCEGSAQTCPASSASAYASFSQRLSRRLKTRPLGEDSRQSRGRADLVTTELDASSAKAAELARGLLAEIRRDAPKAVRADDDTRAKIRRELLEELRNDLLPKARFAQKRCKT